MKLQQRTDSGSGGSSGSGAVIRPKAWTHQEIKTLKMCAGKMPIRMIAATVGRSREATRTKAIRLGIPLAQYGELHPHAKYSNEIVENARRMREMGYSVQRITTETGVKLGTLEDWLYFRRRTNDPVVLQ